MLDITLEVADVRWKRAVRMYRKTVEEACQTACRGKKKRELAVVLASDAMVKELNHTYRGKNKPTNVLSFPGEGASLGDIVLALETVKKEAAAQGKSVRDHTIHLLVHGVLHLLGHDHEKEKNAAKMENEEIKILKKLGVKNPYLYPGQGSGRV